MRYLILSDIHANLQALTAVLADAAREGYDQALVLGDLVGYGGDPSAAMATTLALPVAASIRGNHDKVCSGLEPAIGFSPAARAAADWTRTVLTDAERQRLAALPKGPLVVNADLVICHGAPFDEDYYIFSESDAERAMQTVSARLCLFGHTHVPAVFGTAAADSPFLDPPQDVALSTHGRLLVNVGSVGQPRDGDPRAAYGILDTDAASLRLYRVEYDIAGAQARIRAAGLPSRLADRLEMGR